MAIIAANGERMRDGLGAPGFLLGFSLGGFFDGILLHQILQWHHLLSGVASPAFADLRVQVLADGLFHALMYVVAAIGLALLWRRRAFLADAGAGRVLVGLGLMGFGAWHAVDAVFSHWLTGIHRVRMDSAWPLAWDLGWLAAFGIVPLILGLKTVRGGSGPERGIPAHMAASILAAAVIAGGPVAGLPPRGGDGALVLFGPGMAPADMAAAVGSIGGRMVWADSSGALWAIALDDPRRAHALYGRGAILVSSSWSIAGCLAWSRVA